MKEMEGVSIDGRTYKVTVKVGTLEKIHKVPTFTEALGIQKGASSVAKLLGWTRHTSVKGIVRHTDSVFDLYNEGSIVVKKD